LSDWRRYTKIGRAMGRQDFAAGAVACTDIIESDPRDGFAKAMLAQCYVGMGRTRDALVAADQALEQLPDSFDLLRLATDASVQLNEHSRAREYAGRALAAAAAGRHSASPFLLRLLRSAVRIPVIRRAFHPDRLAEFERFDEESAEWQRWAQAYLNARRDGEQVGASPPSNEPLQPTSGSTQRAESPES
jgi:tetratricopeptide (TPR) repeat protein